MRAGSGHSKSRCQPQLHTTKSSHPCFMTQRGRVFVPKVREALSYGMKLVSTTRWLRARLVRSCQSRCTKWSAFKWPRSFSDDRARVSAVPWPHPSALSLNRAMRCFGLSTWPSGRRSEAACCRRLFDASCLSQQSRNWTHVLAKRDPPTLKRDEARALAKPIGAERASQHR